MADEIKPTEASTEEPQDTQITFKVKTGSEGNHTITMAETATVLDLKTKLAGPEFESVPVERQRLIYSGRVMKNEEPLSTYKIKPGNTVHMVKSAASNAAQNPASGSTPAAVPAVPTNMAAGTANNPLAGLTGARYAGHINLPGRDMFGVDGGMGAPPSEDQMADMLSDPAMAQMMNEALNNPQMIEMMIQSNPTLRQMGPQARQILQSPEFRQVLTNPDMIRQAAAMRRMMGGGGASAFPAPGVTDTTPEGAAASGATGSGAAGAAPVNPFGLFGMPPAAAGGAGGMNPFGGLFNPAMFGQAPGASATPAAAAGTTASPAPAATGATPGSSATTGTTPAPGAPGAASPNPFAALFGGPGAANPFANMTPEMMQAALAGSPFGAGGFNSFGMGGAGSPPPPADTRPPEEMYADQLRQLNDMGFFDFDANVAALRRSGGSVQGAVNQLLGG